MTFKFADVSRNLPQKGFVEDRSGHHRYYYFYRDGKKTRFYTYISQGKPGDDVGDGNVRSMKDQLGLGTMQQVRDLVECRMDKGGYETALIALGRLQPAPKPPAEIGGPLGTERPKPRR
jgi:hypothetical protein